MDAHKVKDQPHRLALAAVVFLSLLTVYSSIAGEPTTSAQVIDGFLQACGENDWLSDEQHEKVLEVVSALRKDKSAQAVITEALRETYPTFGAALNALSDKDTSGAVSRLRTLTTAENPYLAAESYFFLARAYILRDDYEHALPLLETVIEQHASHSLHVGEALFLRGISQLEMLKRLDAMASFTEFLHQYPNAPARMRAAARQNLDLLEQLELGSMNDIHDYIEYSRRQLSLEDSGTKTQKVQDDVVAMLTSLIDEMEKQGGT